MRCSQRRYPMKWTWPRVVVLVVWLIFVLFMVFVISGAIVYFANALIKIRIASVAVPPVPRVIVRERIVERPTYKTPPAPQQPPIINMMMQQQQGGEGSQHQRQGGEADRNQTQWQEPQPETSSEYIHGPCPHCGVVDTFSFYYGVSERDCYGPCRSCNRFLLSVDLDFGLYVGGGVHWRGGGGYHHYRPRHYYRSYHHQQHPRWHTRWRDNTPRSYMMDNDDGDPSPRHSYSSRRHRAHPRRATPKKHYHDRE